MGNIPAKYSDKDEVTNADYGWKPDFERRYPDHDSIDDASENQVTAIARFRRMHDWVVSTKNYDFTDTTVLRVDLVYDEDGNPVWETDENKEVIKDENGNPVQKTKDITIIDIYREEFLEHFNLHYMLIYYVWTFFFLMVDQRAKNMFLTYWKEEDKWSAWFYDNDKLNYNLSL